jgi:nucleoside-diphosphate-sugar epimerase
MKILITGNMGYVGPVLVKHLRKVYPDAYLAGYDMGYFAHCLTGADTLPEIRLDRQFFGDTRSLSLDFLGQFDAIVHLAAVSNDPMGNKFEAATRAINFEASANLAILAARCGVKRFIFASSCSMYGYAEGDARNEADELRPITAYAKSKVDTEKSLQQLSEQGMVITSLRFATACGISDRLRLDLVLNDFVACAVASKKISILSDGSPWRPLINVKDMARAIEWAIIRDSTQGGPYLAVNVGADESNFQVIDLAETISKMIPGTSITINKEATPDKRSYRVSFSLYRKLAPLHQPQVSLEESIAEIQADLKKIKFSDRNFRTSRLMRLIELEEHIDARRLDSTLRWI